MTHDHQSPGRHLVRSRRVLAVLAAMAAIACATLLLIDYRAILPAGVNVSPLLFIAQPTILTMAAVVLGWWAAPKAGLATPLISAAVAGGGWRTRLPRILPSGVLVGLACSAVLGAYAVLTADAFANSPTLEVPLATRVLYGGIGEEIIARYGILSAVMIAGMRLGIGRGAAFWTANAIAALLFALGHFGLLFALVSSPPAWLIAAVLAGNMIPALLYGWLYRDNGLECAMIAHASTHAFAAIGAAVLAGSAL